MEDIRYYPLIDCSTDGSEKTPMFFSTDEKTVSQANTFYLSETVPGHYRLIATDAHDPDKTNRDYHIHCPTCGKIMKVIAAPISDHKLGLFTCQKCK